MEKQTEDKFIYSADFMEQKGIDSLSKIFLLDPEMQATFALRVNIGTLGSEVQARLEFSIDSSDNIVAEKALWIPGRGVLNYHTCAELPRGITAVRLRDTTATVGQRLGTWDLQIRQTKR
ncbi:hypothetical protein EBT16_01910 [bacterium]|nr:hypothetical protein [bacterium]